jgi:uncharacterized protein (TIGR03000 family)
MFQKTFSFIGAVLVAGAAVLMMPGVSQARGGGGGGHGGGGGGHGGGGGGHGGGFGGGHGGGFGGGHFGGGGFGGGRRGGFGGGHFGGYNHYGYGHHRYGGYGYGGYGYYPYYDYGSYGGYYPSYYDNYPYDSGYSSYGEVAPDYGYGADYAAPATGDYYQDLYPASTAAAQPDTIAHLTVKVPADAQLWFNNAPTTTTGTVRQFESPPLAAGKHIYDVQARWTENGHEVTEMRHVQVTQGSHVEVDFPAQPGK